MNNYTHHYTAVYQRESYTRPTGLHEPVVSNYTHHYTDYTHPGLHARHPLYKGAGVSGGGIR